VFPYRGKKRYFSYSHLSITLASIRRYKAYWHMSLLLINGCGTNENNIHGHSSFEVVLVSSSNITIVAKKSKQTSVRKNF